VGGAAYIEGAASRRDRVLSLGVLGAPQAKVEEDARAVLLGHGDVSVPLRDRARPGPSVQVHPGEAEGRRNQRARPSSIRPQALAVLVEPRVVAARTPAGEHFLHRGLVDLEKIGEGLEVWSERDDEADVEIAIGPAVQALADARCEGVVHLRMAKGALGSER